MDPNSSQSKSGDAPPDDKDPDPPNGTPPDDKDQ